MLNWMNFFSGIDVFIPHGHCYLWKPELVGLHILSDSLIALAYYSIPLTLFYFVRKRQDLPFIWVFLLFSAFIVACGTTHLMEIWTLWHPTYWLSGVLKLVTAAISLVTAVSLVQLVPKVLTFPSPAQLEAANQAMQREISERKQAELSLSWLAAIVESSGDAIVSKSLDGVITSWNASAEKLFGYAAEEAVGCSIALLIPPDYADELPQVLEQVRRGVTVERYETVRVRKDGQRITIAATISPVKDATGQVIGAAKIARDVTDRKRAEEQIQASLQEKEVLLKEIHHRVKNNLQIVYSLLRLQRRKLKDQLAANALLESQSRIEAIALIHEKLYQSDDLARINLAEYIPSLITNLFSTYNVNHIQIELKTEIEPAFLNIDKGICCGLIINELLSNSLKYAFPASMQSDPCICINFTKTKDSTFSLIVKDNGIGVPRHINLLHLETLGLQLVQGFVQQLKGTLQANCQSGTAFHILFPGEDL